MSSTRIAKGVLLRTLTYRALIPLTEGAPHLVATYLEGSDERVLKPVRNENDVLSLRWAERLGSIADVRFYASTNGRVTEEDD